MYINIKLLLYKVGFNMFNVHI